jgi:glycosyltransferase involved in cell wall biosynthesis
MKSKALSVSALGWIAAVVAREGEFDLYYFDESGLTLILACRMRGRISEDRALREFPLPARNGSIFLVSWLRQALAEAYAACAFTVAPIFSGSGSNIKVIESLARGRTCAATTSAMRGYDQLRDGDSVRVADSLDQLAASCIDLLSDPMTRHRLADHGRAIVEAEFSYARFAATVRQTVSKLTSQG